MLGGEASLYLGGFSGLYKGGDSGERWYVFAFLHFLLVVAELVVSVRSPVCYCCFLSPSIGQLREFWASDRGPPSNSQDSVAGLRAHFGVGEVIPA